MIRTTERPAATTRFALDAAAFARVGGAVLRYCLVLFLVGFGLYKFTAVEAQAIEPLVRHSPFLGWLYTVTSVQAASNLIGAVEVVLGILIAGRRWWPRLSAIGSLGAGIQFLITLSFLLTTPDLSPDAQGFLVKDVMLFGAALWTAGDALQAAQARH